MGRLEETATRKPDPRLKGEERNLVEKKKDKKGIRTPCIGDT